MSTIDTSNMSIEQLKTMLEAAQAENNKLKAHTSSNRLSFRVSAKGALSVYGLGRFPVTLYKEQWQRLAAAMPELAAFIEQAGSALTVKVREEEKAAA